MQHLAKNGRNENESVNLFRNFRVSVKVDSLVEKRLIIIVGWFLTVVRGRGSKSHMISVDFFLLYKKLTLTHIAEKPEKTNTIIDKPITFRLQCKSRIETAICCILTKEKIESFFFVCDQKKKSCVYCG